MNRINGMVLALMLMTAAGCVRTPQPVALQENKGAGSESPMFGGSPSRNMVNLIDKNIPTTWNVEEKKTENIKWVAKLGNHAYGGPTIAGGKVYVGTNLKVEDVYEKAVLMCFNEADGKFLWKIVHEFPDDPTFAMARGHGLCSTPIVEGDRVYYVAPGAEVICADTDGKVKWTYDMMKELKVIPFHLSNCSPLIVGDILFLLTGNGRDEQFELPSPKAPSFIAVNKKTGKLVWQANLPGENIVTGQWANPALATVNGKPQVIFPGGDAWLYSFEPETGKLIWKCDCNPARPKELTRINYFVSSPVVMGDKLYIGLGYAPDTGSNSPFSYFLCLDITKNGDVSFKTFDAKAVVNKNSALVWAFGGIVDPPPKGRERKNYFGPTMSTAAVHDGLVYVPEVTGYFHCLDAKTGERYWQHDFKEEVWGSAYFVDGNVYVNTSGGEVQVLAPGKKMKILATNSMEENQLHSTPVVANGVLYIATRTRLYAIAKGK